MIPEEKSRVIGEGSRACVFSPPLSCVAHPLPERFQTTAYVSKFVLDRMELNSEFAVKERFVMRGFPFEDYCILIEMEPCTFTVTPDLEACFRRIYAPYHLPPLKVAFNGIFRNGGASLLNYNIVSGTELIRVFKALLRDLVQIHRVGVYHMDIKLANILMDEKEIPVPLPRLIDFGSSIRDMMKEKYIVLYRNFYENHPLFLNILARYVISYGQWEQLEKQIRKQYDRPAFDARGDSAAWKAERTNEEDGVSKMLKLQQKYTVSDYLANVVNPNLHKVDAYMAAYTIDTILELNKELFDDSKEPKLKELRFVLAQMMNPDVLEQWDENQALAYLNKL